jgi:hypothetical protein
LGPAAPPDGALPSSRPTKAKCFTRARTPYRCEFTARRLLQKYLYFYTVVMLHFPTSHFIVSDTMSDAKSTKFIVVPYRKNKDGVLQPGELRQASTEFGAVRIAQSMASGFAGIAAYEVLVDEEDGTMDAPRILFQEGAIPAMAE